MAVPKKHTSKSRKRIRRSVWRVKANETAAKAFSLAKSILTKRSKGFYYATDDESINPSKIVPISDE